MSRGIENDDVNKIVIRVFSLNFWWGGGTRGQSRMGGTCKKNPTETETAHLMQNLAVFCYFKDEIQLFKILLSLKEVKFDTKMYLNFSNFWGRTLAGGTSLGPKTGTSVGWGVDKICAGWGTPQSPQEKKPGHILLL